ncbi:hypothetical protein D9V37_15620 [Nocardioides mangrovicus]|uniref:Uncharacterized protein n=1 Tax=Nocardioides mangrovicus TaxID=2478913 RepID=A0A3L8NXD2_9ACTN|nr:hypothetical protein [Nocardioides mangrovicus]RLV47594.1 hypothetical protein D9V37_15620 [Nocardioides mangrovicus]
MRPAGIPFTSLHAEAGAPSRTEVGDASGTYSHANGYKFDFSRTSCLTSWIHSTYTYTGAWAGDGAPHYQAASGNVYADEGTHWDVTFYSCGC